MKKLALFLLSILVVSCVKEPEHLTKEYFKAQYRDPNLAGKWLSETWYMYEYTALGEMLVYEVYSDDGISYHPVYESEKKVIDYYYYTKGNVIYQLSPGDPLKGSAFTREEQYIIKGDTLIVWNLCNGNLGEPYVTIRKK